MCKSQFPYNTPVNQATSIANDEINDWFRYLHMRNSCFLILVSFLFLFCNLTTNMLLLTAEFTNAIYASVNSSCAQPLSPPGLFPGHKHFCGLGWQIPMAMGTLELSWNWLMHCYFILEEGVVNCTLSWVLWFVTDDNRDNWSAVRKQHSNNSNTTTKTSET